MMFEVMGKRRAEVSLGGFGVVRFVDNKYTQPSVLYLDERTS